MKIKYFLFVILVSSLVACGGSGGSSISTPVPDGNGTNSAPELTPIASKNAVTSNLLRLELDGTDIDGDNLAFSVDVTVGTFNDPFSQSTPAVFDAANGIFEWTPTGTEIGQYSVQFTVTENTTQALSTSIVVDINVDTIGSFGQTHYATYCASCHGIDGTGMTGPDIRLKTDVDITNALNDVTAMQNVASQIDQPQIDSIAYHVLTQFSDTDFHSQFDLSNGCAGCHDGFESFGQPTTHISAKEVCQACHNTTSFAPANIVDHNQVIGVCANCHNGTIAMDKKIGHINTNNNCEACHNTTAFIQVSAVNHAAVIGACIDCHNGTIAMAKSGMHISTNNMCNACHSTVIFNLNKTIAHQNAFGFCGDCHNNVTAIGKQAGHPGTSFDCADCHDTVLF
ncbi:MAG: hypothetical protein GXP19_02050 [Gammaproteobacteria bacterium]|nr:hypothetical protein [Gammaproteobacteria bacterium]